MTATFQDSAGVSETLTGQALIGADGIHSTLRALLHPHDPGIRWNGIQMWRGAVDWPAFDGGDSMVIAGDSVAKLVLYPIGPGTTPETRLTNWVIYARVADRRRRRRRGGRTGPGWAITTRSAIWPNGCTCRSSMSSG